MHTKADEKCGPCPLEQETFPDQIPESLRALQALRKLDGVEAFQYAVAHERVSVLDGGMVRLSGLCLVMFMCATAIGYDASLVGVLLVLPSFQSQFGATIIGAKTGLITAMLPIGNACSLPFIGPLTDTWGRRVGVMIGCGLVVMGSIIQGTSADLPQYLAGRFFLGFGVGVAGGAPAYVVEMAHPRYRGRTAGLFNCFYYAGSFLAGVVLRGCLHYNNDSSWLIPTWLQVALPATILCVCPFMPESPRWLFAHNRKEECRAVLVKYHANGNRESLFVELQMREFKKELDLHGSDKRWWDYRCLFNSRSAFYRAVLCGVAVPALAQFTGQGAVTYFLPGVLSTVGISKPAQVMDINICVALASGVCAVAGASVLDIFGRRKMLIWCCIALVLAWIGTVISTQQFTADHANSHAARAALAFIFLITMLFSAAYTPLQHLYPAECFSYEQRAKGIALAHMGTSVFSLFNLFVTPIALKEIGWKTYCIWIVTCSLQVIYYYFTMVETKGRTLEEMNYIFAQKSPRTASLRYLNSESVTGLDRTKNGGMTVDVPSVVEVEKC
ncbi:hypothetical protein NQ176_g1819 [Zarea fungicola]|uniref:Uncharacterized protein n=1 Tax=Zarea fungicola TaxID=93591 RepID=A0ACC1NTH6_9HYPO|nr:hypothetical protein NQ176_g1819 [Lecanicillium fungicola]